MTKPLRSLKVVSWQFKRTTIEYSCDLLAQNSSWASAVRSFHCYSPLLVHMCTATINYNTTIIVNHNSCRTSRKTSRTALNDVQNQWSNHHACVIPPISRRVRHVTFVVPIRLTSIVLPPYLVLLPKALTNMGLHNINSRR